MWLDRAGLSFSTAGTAGADGIVSWLCGDDEVLSSVAVAGVV